MKTIRTSRSVYLNLVKACTEMKILLLVWVLLFCLAAFYILGKSGGLQLSHCKCNITVQILKACRGPRADKRRGES